MKRANVNRIITVTPNPAIDMTYTVQGITEGSSHRVPTPLSRAGGKGINVARVTHQLGYPVLAIAPTGGAAGQTLAAELWTSGVPHTLVGVAAETRRSIALVDTVAGETSIFNEEGQALLPDDWRSLRIAVVEAVSGNRNLPASVLVGSGSLPPGAPADFYPELVRLAHDAGIPAIIDTSGPGIIAAAKAGADILKPNHHELAEATGESSLEAAALSLIEMGARTVLVSAGADGMLAFDHAAPGGYWSARLPESLSGNPTGAGDAGVAAAAVALAEGITEPREILRRATAWSAAAVLMPAAGEISPRYQELQEQLIVTWKGDPVTLVNTRELMDRAAAGIGQGAFNIIHIETAEGLVAGAEAAGVPLILQISENCAKYHGGLEPIASAALAIARSATVPVALHLDHAESEDLALAAVDLGFGSVMYDGAHLPYEWNVEVTQRVATYAHERGVYVEAELGKVGGKDGAHAPGVRTDPAEAHAFVEATGVDALAVAVGSSHAMTERSAALDLHLITRLKTAVGKPLVLHGSSGVSDDILIGAIRAGMTKINVSTHLNGFFTRAVREYLDANPAVVDSRKYIKAGRDALVLESARMLTLFAKAN